MGYRRSAEVAEDRARQVTRVLAGVLILNVAVAVAKLAYGGLSGSVAMVADGFHSLFDGASNVVGLVGVWAARRPADATHPYGHGKYETWASMAIGALLALAAWNVATTAVERLLSDGPTARVDAGSFIVMGVTICVNVGVSLYERRVGRRLNSEILLADASHTASDVFVSAGVIAGLVAVRMGFPLADPIIALLVAAMIARTAWRVFQRAEYTFSDRARLSADELAEVCLSVDGALGCHEVRTRGSLSNVYVDLHVQVDPGVSVLAAHEIAESVERAIVEGFSEVADAIVHIEPLDEYQAEKSSEQWASQ